ncbi:effector-associated constant component EACC1 [Streptomyces niveus]|uniref:effector-associated constant component EACC1 n=1 Tax=Streptomyces niveus TaxID=193462 RepID=UPI0036B530FD
MNKHSDGQGQRQLLISVVDDDPLRARSDARELLGEVSGVDPTASLRLPSADSSADTDKGGDVVGAIGLALSGGSFAVACVQTWLTKVPQRTIIVARPDGATMRITGREAREDEERVERFLSGGSPAHESAADATPGRDDHPTVG